MLARRTRVDSHQPLPKKNQANSKLPSLVKGPSVLRVVAVAQSSSWLTIQEKKLNMVKGRANAPSKIRSKKTM